MLAVIFMTSSQFKEIAFKALRESYYETQVFNLSFDGNVTKITEYFITVNLCKQLYLWNSNNYYPYKIEAEKATYDFYQNCFEHYKLEEKDNIFSKTLFSSNFEEFNKNLTPIRKGKIDIVLSKATNQYRDVSEYIIEVKSVNPTLNKLKDDFKRIQSYLTAEIPNFENSLKSGFIVFIKHINKLRKIQNNQNLLESQQEYINYLSKHFTNLCSSGITNSISIKQIEHSPFESLNIDSDDFGEIAYNTFTAFSIVVEIKYNR